MGGTVLQSIKRKNDFGMFRNRGVNVTYRAVPSRVSPLEKKFKKEIGPKIMKKRATSYYKKEYGYLIWLQLYSNM